MAENFPPTVDELLENFDLFDVWEERYDYLIELGRELPALDEKHQNSDTKVEGCMSSVWLVTSMDSERKIHISADSDSIIVKGLIVILMAHYSGKTASEILDSDAIALFERLGLNQHLSPQRRNGLFSMVKRLKEMASEIAQQ